MDRNLVFLESSAWLRYVFWGAAIGMLLLAAGAINATDRDLERALECLLGALLFGFCGFVFTTRRVIVDPLRRVVTITSKRFRHESTETMRFDEIKKVLVLMTFDRIENLQGAEVLRERWYIAFALAGRTVTVTRNLYLTKEQALHDAQRIQRLLCVELSDSPEESIAQLAQSGRKIEAVALASRAHAMSTVQAMEFVDGNAGPNSRSKETSVSGYRSVEPPAPGNGG